MTETGQERPASSGPRAGSKLGPRYEAAVLGFPDYWYPGMLSRHLGKKPVAIKLLGQNLVFFRAHGRAYALHDLCAHRGVPLSLGTCLAEGTVTCGYHGWTYDLATGTCVAALTDGPDSPAVGRYAVQTYPVEERGGIVFVYMGAGTPLPLEEDVPEEAIRPDWTQQVVVSVWHGNWRAAVENGYDAGHAPYVHRNSLRWRTAGSLQPAWATAVGSEVIGPYLRQRRGKPGPSEADYPVVGRWPRHSWLRRFLAEVGKKPGRQRPYPNEFRLPGLIHNKYFYYTHIRWAVPVDEHSTRNFQVYAGQYEGTRSLAFRLHYWLWHRWVLPHAVQRPGRVDCRGVGLRSAGATLSARHFDPRPTQVRRSPRANGRSVVQQRAWRGESRMKRVLIVLLAIVGLRIVVPYVRRFADPDPSLYGHPRRRV